jgi:hypothetical protein
MASFAYPSDMPCNKVLTLAQITVPAAAQSGQLALSAGFDYVCSLSRAGGRVTCWGPSDPQVPAWARAGAVALAAGPFYTCIINSAGAVRCWAVGEAAFAAAGEHDSELSSPIYTPLRVSSGQVAVAAGLDHACALDEQGRVACWGLTAGARVPEMLSAPGAVRLPCVPRDAASLPPPTPPEARCAASGLRPFPGHDAIGTQLRSLRVADEAQCRAACCAQQPACVGCSLVAREVPAAATGGDGEAAVPCVLLSSVRQLVPPNLMSSGVRPDALPADAARG